MKLALVGECGGEYEAALRASGLLVDAAPDGYVPTWLANAERRRIAPQVVVAVARQHALTPAGFAVLDRMTEIVDPDGKSFFLVTPGIGRAELCAAVMATYLLNADTGYRTGDFPEPTYSVDEARRIADRQRANGWSYAAALQVCSAGGSLVTTPNGMLMGVAGNRIHGWFSQRGGTAYGDLFLVNSGGSADPAGLVRRIIRSGHAWFDHRGRLVGTPDRDLDRLLHHEERHAQQWARLGPVRMGAGYLAEEARVRIFGGLNRFEVDAGLRDGGYR